MPGECVLVCERAGAPVIRVTVFTFPLRRTGAQAAHGEGGALHCAHMDVYVCVFLRLSECLGYVCLYGGVCVFRIIALQSFLDRPSGALMSQEGFGCCWFPLNGRGISLFSFSPFSLFPSSAPSTTKVFIDYLVPLFNNLILGDSALCSHRN